MLIEVYLNYKQFKFIIDETKKRECNSSIMETK